MKLIRRLKKNALYFHGGHAGTGFRGVRQLQLSFSRAFLFSHGIFLTSSPNVHWGDQLSPASKCGSHDIVSGAASSSTRLYRDNTQNRLRFGTETVYDHKSLEKNFCIFYIIFFNEKLRFSEKLMVFHWFWWIFDEYLLDFDGYFHQNQ